MRFKRLTLVASVIGLAMASPGYATDDGCSAATAKLDQAIASGNLDVRPNVPRADMIKALCLLLQAQADARNVQRKLYYTFTYTVQGRQEAADWSPRTALLLLKLENLTSVEVIKSRQLNSPELSFTFMPEGRGVGKEYFRVRITPPYDDRLIALAITNGITLPGPPVPPPPKGAGTSKTN